MQLTFWDKLKKPFFALAPMADVTDAAFRQMFVECGKPDVFWTEFVSIGGLCSKGKEALLPDLWFGEGEHPIVAQIFGVEHENYEKTGALIRELGFDGVDINMGCPSRDIEKQKAGAALIRTPKLAKEAIRALKKGAGGLPVSVKTRVGYASKDEMSVWLQVLLEEDLAALTLHLRTRMEMSAVPAQWELAHEIVELRNCVAPKTILIGNGDLNSMEEARERVKESGMDGAMIGRGVFGNPWFFSERIPDVRERLNRMVKHAELFEKKFAGIKNFSVMKKHFGAYVTGFEGAKELRMRLMGTENAEDVKNITEEFVLQ